MTRKNWLSGEIGAVIGLPSVISTDETAEVQKPEILTAKYTK